MMRIPIVMSIFEKIRSESSKNGKIKIISDNRDNKLFLLLLDFVYNPYFVTGVSNKKLSKDVSEVEVKDEHHFKEIEKVLNYLKENNTGKDYDVAVLNKFCEHIPEDGKIFLNEVFAKTYKCGVTSSSINKALGKDFIPSFGVMLAESYEKKEASVTSRFFLTLKLDGNRCLAVREDDKVSFYTRKGIEIKDMNELSKDMLSLPSGWVYDGEVILRNDGGLDSEKLFRETQKVIRKDGEKNNLQFYIFDNLPLSEFRNGESKNDYSKRRKQLDLLAVRASKLENIFVIPTLYEGEDKSMIEKLMIEYVEKNGLEGLMLNKADGKYKTKRTADLLKIKKFKSADLLVMGVVEGEGNFEGMLGAVLVQYKDNIVNVGSGFTLDERIKYWKDKDEITGKIIEVAYFNESENQNGGLSLRFPTFKGVRHDKDVEDIRYE